MSQNGWIGVDLDGTLAHYDTWIGVGHIGQPIPAMLDRVKLWLAEGKEVRIFTARVAPQPNRLHDLARARIEDWCIKHIGQRLEITCSKDFDMLELWDDRCVQVAPNEGRRVDEWFALVSDSPDRVASRDALFGTVAVSRIALAEALDPFGMVDYALTDLRREFAKALNMRSVPPLAIVKHLIEQKDAAYAERNKCVALIAWLALEARTPKRIRGIAPDPRFDAWLGRHEESDESCWDADWRNIVFVRIPTGQISWHIHDSDLPMFAFLPRRIKVGEISGADIVADSSISPPDLLLAIANLHEYQWDGHTTEEKYRRILELVAPALTSDPAATKAFRESQDILANAFQQVEAEGRVAP